MAHADYNCCAVCARKLEYKGVNANHKNKICERCQVTLRDRGHPIITPAELMGWVKSSPEEALKTLDDIGFTECHYQTYVDTFVNTVRENVSDTES